MIKITYTGRITQRIPRWNTIFYFHNFYFFI
jgi:hypothetical protein